MWQFIFALASGQAEPNSLSQVLDNIHAHIGEISKEDALWLKHGKYPFLLALLSL
jgi:hypothetical protein